MKDKVEGSIPEGKKQLLDKYLALAMNMIHAPESHNNIKKMLGSGPPEVSVPNTTMTINQYLEKNTPGESQVDITLAAIPAIVSDLVEIGNGEGLFQVDKNTIQPLIQDSSSQFIEGGLKAGTIDPVELQLKMGPLLRKGDAKQRMEAGGKQGIPHAPTPDMINRRTGKDAVDQYKTQQGVLG